jgi:hypothetical protein
MRRMQRRRRSRRGRGGGGFTEPYGAATEVFCSVDQKNIIKRAYLITKAELPEK